MALQMPDNKCIRVANADEGGVPYGQAYAWSRTRMGGVEESTCGSMCQRLE